MKCLYTFTNLVLIFNVIALCIPNVPKYIKITAMNLLIYIIICGNVLIFTHRKSIQKVCNINLVLLDIGNILFHICIPILFIVLWMFYKNIKNNFRTVTTSVLAGIISIFIGGLYLVFMNLNIVFDYGLPQNIINIYITVFILLTVINCSIFLYKNKK